MSAIWALKFEQKDSKLRVVQIKDMKQNKVKYEFKKNQMKLPTKILRRFQTPAYCLVGKYKDSELKRYQKAL